uniref:Uncharacterized protein n=1 Tax=viral metagenome TaxID=1070528 RepID=A0A6M3M9G8_9ZZZZ
MLPERSWESVAKRLRLAIEGAPSGAAVVVMRVLVVDGRPRVWLAPRVARLEPASCASAFLEAVAGDLDGG